ncbi:hypothetical protein WMF04_38055 [Sorangium sp. So ce260]|jgi:hypothetical protein|uniref:hypothetical protein n=1 Tax=Sorangium sp. So ce260 TaxID=3133291 RepID=UPI003F611DFA
MKLARALVVSFSTAAASGCGGPPPSPLPPTTAAAAEPEVTLVWVGRGESERFAEGQWVRTPESDYDFSVVQRRYKGRWDSIKEMHRRHPGYDGAAGPRDQVLHFALEVGAKQGSDVPVIIRSTLGDGDGRTDPEFRNSQLQMRARDVSSFAPFNAYRITQQYQYGEGKLVETVELIERDGEGRESPFVRIRERAALFAPTSFEQPPTRAEAVSSIRP